MPFHRPSGIHCQTLEWIKRINVLNQSSTPSIFSQYINGNLKFIVVDVYIDITSIYTPDMLVSCSSNDSSCWSLESSVILEFDWQLDPVSRLSSHSIPIPVSWSEVSDFSLTFSLSDESWMSFANLDNSDGLDWPSILQIRRTVRPTISRKTKWKKRVTQILFFDIFYFLRIKNQTHCVVNVSHNVAVVLKSEQTADFTNRQH